MPQRLGSTTSGECRNLECWNEIENAKALPEKIPVAADAVQVSMPDYPEITLRQQQIMRRVNELHGHARRGDRYFSERRKTLVAELAEHGKRLEAACKDAGFTLSTDALVTEARETFLERAA